MRVLLAAVAALVLVLCAPARAATVSFTAPYVEPPGTEPEESCSRYMACPGPSIEFRANPGERNAVTLVTEGATLVFRDAGAPLTAGPGCSARPDGTVACPGGETNVHLGDGDDRFEAPGATIAGVRGGDGADVLAGARSLRGERGDDVLTGGPGAESLDPGPGRDTVTAGAGDDLVLDDDIDPEPDRLDGGEGRDGLQFHQRVADVRIDLGARPQQGGSAGEANEVAGFEHAQGGLGDDELIGDPAAPPSDLVVLDGIDGDDRLVDRGAGDGGLIGGTGDDVLVAAAGDNLVDGGPGADRLDGADGDDRLLGESGADVVRGGAGDDVLDGGPDGDRLFGGAGRDRIVARDGRRDRISCGRGRDRLTADRRDRARSCERVRRRR